VNEGRWWILDEGRWWILDEWRRRDVLEERAVDRREKAF
jgi:hypothetical protein